MPAVYGPGDPQKRFDAWMQPEVVMSETYARWRWTRGFVENVADAIVLAATNDAAAGRVFNVGHLVTDTTAIRRELGYAERVSRARAIAELP